MPPPLQNERPDSLPPSPFDDYRYLVHEDMKFGNTYQDRYNSTPTKLPSNPFDDGNAIPLQNQFFKAENNPYVSTREQQYRDQEVFTPSSPVQQDMDVRRGGGLWRPTQKIPWVVYTLTVIQIGVFIGEIAKNIILTESPIEIHPQFNPMIGPSPYVLINMGARYVACMRNEDQIQNAVETIAWPCPNQTTSTAGCSLSELCGFSGVPNPHAGGTLDESPAPNQWFRFIVPMFLHAGIIHIAFNMLLQMLLGRDMERAIGSLRFALVYFSSGIFGFVLGGNFAAPGIASTGASGCLFGIIALVLLDLLYTWRDRMHPIKDLLFILMDIIVSFVLGLLPGLDNFSHIGGFLMGLVLGVCLLHSPNALRLRTGQDDYLEPDGAVRVRHSRPTYTDHQYNGKPVPPIPSDITAFTRQPIGFFRGRKPLWWAWWLLRTGALCGVIAAFGVLIKNFYNNHSTTCNWCKYLSCLPVNNWCDIGNLNFQQVNSTTPRVRRDG